jgi:hypothetical protein
LIFDGTDIPNDKSDRKPIRMTLFHNTERSKGKWIAETERRNRRCKRKTT